MAENNVENKSENSAINSNWGGNMPQRTRNKAQIINLFEIVSQLEKSAREKLISGYDIKNFARLFEDAETMATVNCFLKNGMNVSETARKLYMHRNTLIYRLKRIKKITGLDLRDFGCAVTFEILRSLYELK